MFKNLQSKGLQLQGLKTQPKASQSSYRWIYKTESYKAYNAVLELAMYPASLILQILVAIFIYPRIWSELLAQKSKSYAFLATCIISSAKVKKRNKTVTWSIDFLTLLLFIYLLYAYNK